MKDRQLEIEVKIEIQKTAHEVYEAIADPAKMSGYFISHGTGRIDEEKEIFWRFPEFDAEFPVRTGKTVNDKYISFYWEVDNVELMVEITLEARGDNSTLVTVIEKSRENDEAGLKWLAGNTAGWANFLACLKAYMEYGINLRKGAFDFLK